MLHYQEQTISSASVERLLLSAVWMGDVHISFLMTSNLFPNKIVDLTVGSSEKNHLRQIIFLGSVM